MPPRRTKAAPPIPSLQNCSIAFGSNAIPAGVLANKSLAEVKTEISTKGGTYATKLVDSTHLVVTETQYKKSLAKVEAAKTNPRIKIVSYEWLEKVLDSTGMIDEAPYELKDSSTLATNGTTGSMSAVKNDDAAHPKPTKSKKRKRDAEDAVSQSTPPCTHANGKAVNVGKKQDLNIPLDEGVSSRIGSNCKVYIDDDGNFFDATLNQSDAGKNANKFYRMQLVMASSGVWNCVVRWGRVGEFGQCMVLGDGSFEGAMREFDKKFKDKTGNKWEDRATGEIHPKKYVFIERSYEDSDSEGKGGPPGAEKRTKVTKEEDSERSEIKSRLSEPVQRLLKLIFNQEYFNNTYAEYDYDAEKMPLGKLSKTSLMRGYEVLKSLASLVGTSGDRTQIENLSNQYLSLIPHVVKRNARPPVLNSMEKVKKEIELLEALTDMQLANDLMKNAKKGQTGEQVSLLDRQYAGLGLQEMSPLDKGSSEFKELENYLTKSVGHTHGTRYIVQDIFRIEREGEHARFAKSGFAKVKNKNRRLLWHGSRTTNFGGILSQGLRIAPPEAPVSGYMFGKGVYLADMSSKSANYCWAGSSGGTGLLLLCEAELGDPPLKLTNADYNAGDRAKAANCLSTWGVGRTAPKAWKDAGSVHKSLEGISMPDVITQAPGDTGEAAAYLQYNEYIVYDVAQIKLRYLFRVTM